MFSEYLDSLFKTDLDDEIHRPGIVVRRIDFKSTILQIWVKRKKKQPPIQNSQHNWNTLSVDSEQSLLLLLLLFSSLSTGPSRRPRRHFLTLFVGHPILVGSLGRPGHGLGPYKFPFLGLTFGFFWFGIFLEIVANWGQRYKWQIIIFCSKK